MMHREMDGCEEGIVTAVMPFVSKSGEYSSYDACMFYSKHNIIGWDSCLLFRIHFFLFAYLLSDFRKTSRSENGNARLFVLGL